MGHEIHVAIETKISPFNHLLIFATFDTSFKEAPHTITMVSLEAKHISYDVDENITITSTKINEPAELIALLPPGFNELAYAQRLQERHMDAPQEEPEELFQPSRHFDLHLKGAKDIYSKHSRITLTPMVAP